MARGYYEPSSAARVLETEEDFWQSQRQRLVVEEERSAEERNRRRRRKQHSRRNQQKALLMSRGYVAFLSFAVIITCITAGYYIKLQAEVLEHMRSIASLEASVNNIKFTNDADEKRLYSVVDLQEIRDEAISLGMGYADPDRIVYYSVEHPDYMTQYSEIP